MVPSSSARSHSSSSTLKLSSPPSNRPDFLDSDHSDEDHDDSLDPTTPKQPSSSYSDRLNSLLGREAGGGGDEQDEEGEGQDDEDDDVDFRYDGQDGIDEERQEQRLAQWAEEDEDEKGSIRDYDQTMKDILGEEEAREEAQAQGEEELESFAVERGVGFDDDVRSDKTPSTSSQTNLGFSASFSPTSHGRSPSGSIASSSKLQSSRRPPFLHPTVSRLRSHMRNPSSSSSIQTTNGYGNGNGLLPRSASTSSHFSQLSRTTSSSTIHSLLQQPTQPSNGSASSSRPPPPPKRAEDPFHYTSLKRISAFLFPNPSKGATSAAKLAAMGLGAGAGAGGQELKREMLGKPVMIVVGGLICVGTDKGWVGTWGFGGEAKGWYGNETISKEAGPVTALSLSPDHTYIAVGHAQGHIYLYQLNNSSSPSPPPSKSSRSSSSSTSGGSFIPTRTALPIQLSSALLGKREGHLLGTRILHIGFVGKRHTAIVSGDERGMAFYHSLGRVLGVDSTDVLRVLGSYPTEGPQGGSRPSSSTSSDPAASRSSTKPPPITTLFATAPLPLGPHASDTYQLSALLTPSKLVIVGLKPSPRTWYRKLRSLGAGLAEGGEEGGLVGGAVWRTGASSSLPSLEKGGAISTEERDPLLAFWWGNVLKFVGVRVVEVEAGGVGNAGEVGGGKKGAAGESVKRVEFLEAGRWEAEGVVRELEWLNEHHLLVLTSSALSVLDTRTMDRVERSDIDCRMLISNDFYSEVQRRRTKHHTIIENGNGHESATSLSSVAGSFSSYKGKVFFLTKADVRTGSIISWTDRLLALMEVGDILSAIRLATTYYLGSHRSTVLGLPETTPERKKLVGSRLEELIRSSLRYTFSDDRMTDGTHESRDGRGVDRTELFEGLVTETANACLALDDLDFFFDDVFERYQDVGIEGIFFDQLEPFILEGRIRTIPTNVVQRLFQLLDDRDQLEKLETIIWHVDPRCLDINQAITICQKHRLWDALVYVYTRSLADFVSPVVELLGVVRRIQQHRIERPQRIGGESWSMRNGGTGGGLTDDEVEALVPDAYKLYSYLSDVLSGLAYPSKEVMSEEESIPAKTSVYSFVFSGRTTSGIQGGPLIATVSKGNSEPTYPYLRLLLQFDAEAFLHAMDIAFEDSYLNDDVTDKDISRQLIINLMLDAMDPEEFSPSDVTLLHIFVSRNLPKYPQFIILPPSTLHRILEALATDPDQSTREDRQLAAEYLLSAYTPHDTDRMLALFESAGFFRILRSTYRAERKWAALVSTYFKDPDSGFDVFASVDEILAVASSSKSSVPEDLKETVLEAIPHLSDFGIRQTALLAPENLQEIVLLTVLPISFSPFMTTPPPTGIAILGAGLFPHLAYLPSLVPHASSISIKALYSRSAKSGVSLAQAAAEKLPPSAFKADEVAIYSDDGEKGGLDELLKREDVEAVLIALPIPQIPEAVIKALEAGKHVLSEKPIAKDIETAKALIKTYREKYAPKGLIWRVAENWENEPVFLAAKKVLADKEQGELRSFAWNSSSRTEQGSRWISTDWRTVPTYQGGFILDGGVHSAAALRLILPSPPATLVAFSTLTLAYLAPTDTLTSLVSLSSGIVGSFYLTFAAPADKPAPPLFEAWSEKGWLEIKQVEGGFALTVFGEDGGEGKEEKFGNEGVEREFGSFFARLRGGEGSEDGVGKVEETLKDLVLIESGLKSQGVKVDLIERARV